MMTFDARSGILASRSDPFLAIICKLPGKCAKCSGDFGKGGPMVTCFRCVALALLLMAVAAPASAYIDPGTGSLILQTVLGGLAGLFVAWKFLWHRVKSWFVRNRIT